MIEPKVFYRELDAMLDKIRKEESGEHFLVSILMELERRFGVSLNIHVSHVYELRGDDFVLIHSTADKTKVKIAKRLSVDDPTIQLAIENRSYIYNKPEFLGTFCQTETEAHVVPAAITVNSPERKWLFVFEMAEGLVYEEVTLFLNAVRTALNYRMFSEMMTTELERSVQIQKSLLPKSALTIDGYQIFGYSQAAELVGGDFYDYFDFDDSTFGISIGDASGHGMPAALLVRDVVIGLRMGLAKEMRIVYTLKKLNQVIQRSTYSTNFVSLFIAEIEKDGHLFYVNAGHPPPFLIGGQGVQELPATGITLGFLPDIDLARSYIHMEPGTVLISYTDGIIERINNRGEMYELDRLKKTVIQNQEKTAEDIVNLVFEEVYQFGGQTNWEDDATIVVIKRMKENGNDTETGSPSQG